MKKKITKYSKLWKHSKTQIVTKVKNLNDDKTKYLNFSEKVKIWNCENLNNDYVTIPKFWENSNNDKIQNIKKCYKQQSGPQIVTKLKNSNCDKT